MFYEGGKGFDTEGSKRVIWTTEVYPEGDCGPKVGREVRINKDGVLYCRYANGIQELTEADEFVYTAI